MRKLFKLLAVAVVSLAVLLSAGCPKKGSVKDSPEEGEEQQEPGPEIPRPGAH